MRFIDADALAEVLEISDDCEKCKHGLWAFCTKGSEFVNACEAIFDAPTIETKKCKDCKYFTYRVRYGYEETYGCDHPLLEYATECDDYWLNMTEDCFCSMWEAKNERNH